MTVAIPEAVGSAARGGKVIRAERAASSGRGATYDTYNTRTRRARAEPRQARSSGAAGQAAAAYGASAAGAARSARVPGDRQYQGVILAEFATAVLIVSLAPLARGKRSTDTSAAPWGDPNAAGSSAYGPSPYGVDDFKQLLGIGAVYFILALLSSGRHGKMAAWFGGLILIAIGLSQTASGGLPAIFGIFQPGGLSGGSAGSSADQAGLPAGFTPIADQNLAQDTLAPVGGQYSPVQNATGIFPVVTPGGQVIPAGVVVPTPTGAPTFTQQVTQAGTGALVQSYTGGPGVVTTNTGTQVA